MHLSTQVASNEHHSHRLQASSGSGQLRIVSCITSASLHGRYDSSLPDLHRTKNNTNKIAALSCAAKWRKQQERAGHKKHSIRDKGARSKQTGQSDGIRSDGCRRRHCSRRNKEAGVSHTGQRYAIGRKSGLEVSAEHAWWPGSWTGGFGGM